MDFLSSMMAQMDDTYGGTKQKPKSAAELHAERMRKEARNKEKEARQRWRKMCQDNIKKFLAGKDKRFVFASQEDELKAVIIKEECAAAGLNAIVVRTKDLQSGIYDTGVDVEDEMVQPGSILVYRPGQEPMVEKSATIYGKLEADRKRASDASRLKNQQKRKRVKVNMDNNANLVKLNVVKRDLRSVEQVEKDILRKKRESTSKAEEEKGGHHSSTSSAAASASASASSSSSSGATPAATATPVVSSDVPQVPPKS